MTYVCSSSILDSLALKFPSKSSRYKSINHIERIENWVLPARKLS
jgi:hypothetical protein